MGCEPSQNTNRQTIEVEQVSKYIIDSHLQSWHLIPAKTSPIFEEYHFMNYLSRSNNSYLRKIKHRKSKYYRVAKVYYRTKNNELIALNQINAMKKLDHPNIVRLHQYFMDQSNIYLIFQYIDGEELFGHLLGVDEAVRQNFPSIFHQLLSALEYCHNCGYAHLGIQPQNIMIIKKNDKYLLKLVGFSKSINFLNKKKIHDQRIQIKRMQSRISVMYRAPEVSNANTVQKSDIWMAGLILLIVITGRNFMIEIQKQDINDVIDQWEQENPDFYKLINLIRHMLDPNPLNRYSAKQCLSHSFLSQNSQEMYRWRMTLVYNFLHNFKQKNRLRKLFQMHILHRISTIHDQTQFMVEFKNLDKNKDGVLDYEELVQGLMNSYFIKKEQAQKYVHQILEKLDSNQNNRLQYSQFLMGTIQIGKLVNEANIDKLFNEIDRNNDGKITLQQIKNMFYDFPIQHAIFQSQKGITYAQFKAFMLDISKQPVKISPL